MSEVNQSLLPILHDTYLAMINNSIGSKSYQNFFAMVDGQKQDIMSGGELSCAFFVSSIATLFGFSKQIHGTVQSTIKDLLSSGGKEVADPLAGVVLVWEAKQFDDKSHMHIGFYIGDGMAISNSYLEKVPVKHEWTFDGKRKVVKIISLMN